MARQVSVARIWKFGTFFGAGVTVVVWLTVSEHSPLHQYLLWHPEIANAVVAPNIAAVIIGALASGNVHQPSELVTYAAIFIQWTLLGTLVSWLVLRRKVPARDG